MYNNTVRILSNLKHVQVCSCNDPKFSDRLVWANSADCSSKIGLLLEEHSDQGLHYLQYWLQYSMAKPLFSSFRMITAKYSSVRNLPKIQTKTPNLKVFYQKHANGIANSKDPDQTLL